MEVAEFKNIVWDYSRKIAENMNSISGPVAEKYGLTMMQIRILIELHQGASHTIGSLADSVCVAGTNISAMCKRLETQGLVERIRNREDERVVQVALTEQGKRLAAEIDNAINDRLSEQLVSEMEEAFDDIILGLRKLDDILQKVGKVNK